MSHFICVSVFCQPAQHVNTRIFIDLETALRYGYSELEERGARHWFHAYPLSITGTPRIFTGNVEDTYLHSMDVWVRTARELWGLSTAAPPLAPPPEPEREHCCTQERRCKRAASLARVYIEASTTRPPDSLRAARALDLYTRHLRHRKVIKAGTTVRPTHPDTWED